MRAQNRSLTFLKVVLLCCFATLSQSLFAATPSVDSVLAPLRRQREALLTEKSWTFVFTVESTVHVPGSYAYSRVNVTDRRRGKEFHVTAEFPPGSLLLKPDAPGRTVDYAFTKNTAYDRTDYALRITPRPLTQHFSNHDYTDYQHINIYEGLTMPAGRVGPYEPTQPFVPETVLKNLSGYSVHEARETINGANCFVLERPGLDVIWIDEQGNLYQRQLHWGPDEAIKLITTANDFREHPQGIWLPQTISTKHFDNPKSPREFPGGAKAKPGEPKYELKITLISASFELLLDEALSVKAPVVGMQVTDRVRGVRYVVPRAGEQAVETPLDAKN